jgi:hypothetical protein
MQKDEYLKNHKARAIKIINDFHIQMRPENLKELHELTQNKIDSPLTPRDEKILLQVVIEQIERELKND